MKCPKHAGRGRPPKACAECAQLSALPFLAQAMIQSEMTGDIGVVVKNGEVVEITDPPRPAKPIKARTRPLSSEIPEAEAAGTYVCAFCLRDFGKNREACSKHIDKCSAHVPGDQPLIILRTPLSF